MAFLLLYVAITVGSALGLSVLIVVTTLVRVWRSQSGPVIPAPALLLSEPLACSLEVRGALISPQCCLLQSKSGKRLQGGAVPGRVARLQRLGVLVEP